MLELDGRSLTFEQFRDRCLKPNVPAIIRHAAPHSYVSDCGCGSEACFSPLDVMQSWLAPISIAAAFGKDHMLPITETFVTSSVDGQMACGEKSLSDVVACWRDGSRVLYLKDWHMQAEMEAMTHSSCAQCLPEGASRGPDSGDAGSAKEQPPVVVKTLHGNGMYRVPRYLGPDWMDEFCRFSQEGEINYQYFGRKKSDYRFAYIGPPDTWTPLHFDVFGTYSWSLNICGEKLWFFPTLEGNEALLASGLGGIALAPDIRTTTGAELHGIVQHPGDLVFVPSRYLHQVHNIKGLYFPLPQVDTGVETDGGVSLIISINHNWCNEWCIEKMVETFCTDAKRLGSLLGDEERVALFSDDVEAWHDHVEAMLLGGTNWNFGCIRSFLSHRLRAIEAAASVGTEGERVRRLVEACLRRVDEVEIQVARCLKNTVTYSSCNTCCLGVAQ